MRNGPSLGSFYAIFYTNATEVGCGLSVCLRTRILCTIRYRLLCISYNNYMTVYEDGYYVLRRLVHVKNSHTFCVDRSTTFGPLEFFQKRRYAKV